MTAFARAPAGSTERSGCQRPRALVEVVANGPRLAHARLVVYPVPDRRRDDRMQDRKLDEPAGPQYPRDLAQRSLGIGDVHQAHERGDRIESRRAERQHGPIADQIANPVPVLAYSRRDEQLGNIEGDDTRAPAGQQPGVVPLTTAQVQAQQPVHRRQQAEERGRVHQVPVAVEAAPGQLRPGGGVRVPDLPGIGAFHPRHARTPPARR